MPKEIIAKLERILILIKHGYERVDLLIAGDLITQVANELRKHLEETKR